MNSRFAWITWERQQRNVSMASLLNADYFEFKGPKFYLVRVIINLVRTFFVFLKPYDIIFVQNPSIVLCFFSCILGTVLRKKVIIDAHNAGVRPLEGRSKILSFMNTLILRSAHLVIVSNQSLVNYLLEKKVVAIPMPDPLPELSRYKSDRSQYLYDIFIICSWSDDEPIDQYFLSAIDLPDLSFGITGNFSKRISQFDDVPSNLHLMGFIDEDEYFSRLSRSKIVVDLTYRDDCLVCGAYEAIALAVPVILTDSMVNRTVFPKGVVFSTCSANDIKVKIVETINNRSRLALETQELQDLLNCHSAKMKTEILKLIQD